MATSFLRLSLLFAIVGLTLRATSCGEVEFVRKLIPKGSTTERGEFPFVVSLYSVKEKKFICGGWLISANHILRAAHCAKTPGRTLLPDDEIVYLGAYDLTSRNESGVVQRNVAEIHVHPDWNEYSVKYDADLAILVLSETASFTYHIRSVCMPSDNSVIKGANGTIVGWGLTENGTQPHLKYPKQGVTVGLKDSYCYTTDYIIASISSLRTFCGSGDVSSPNTGDSGGGFFVRYGSAWVQYGIISAIRANGINYVDQNSIAVYTSVKFFKTCIIDVVRQSGGEIGETNRMSKIKIQIQSVYGCFVDDLDLDIRTENIEIASFTGSNQDGDTDKNVQLLEFKNGTIFYVTDGIGNIFKNLQIFSLTESKLGKINENTFANNTQLWAIFLHENKLNFILGNLFRNNCLLETVGLFGNNLITVDEMTFVNNPQLRHVDLSLNQLELLQANLFTNITKLIEVYLCKSQLDFIPGNLFRNNLLLERVLLGENKLKTVDEVTFANNYKLRIVQLDTNQLELLPGNLFRKNSLLEEVSLRANSLKTVVEVTFVNNPQLRVVNLFSNQLQLLPGDLFTNSLLLEAVFLGENNLTTVGKVTFANKGKLISVDLSSNQLKSIDEVTFVNNGQLKTVDLSSNQIAFLPGNLFKNSLL